MNVFGTKTSKNQILRIKLLPKIIFWKIFTPGKKKDFEPLFTFWSISKQTADFYRMSLHKNDRLLMLYVLASIVFLYHQWLRWDFEMLDWLLHQPGVTSIHTKEHAALLYWSLSIPPKVILSKQDKWHNLTEKGGFFYSKVKTCNFQISRHPKTDNASRWWHAAISLKRLHFRQFSSH